MKVSVVIPVYNEEARIRECLNSLFRNTEQPFEVILADGGSEDRTVEIAREFPGVRVLANPSRTAAAGRNVGIKHARGDVIAFTDGDCIADSGWIAAIRRCFEERPGLDGVRGKITSAPGVNKYERYWNRLAWELLMQFGDEPHEIRERNLADALVTANCAYRRRTLVRLKGFSRWFGNNAEDVDLTWRALDAGAVLTYDPRIVIQAHGVTSREGIAKKSFRNGVSSSKLQKRYGGKINYDVNIYKMLGSNLRAVFSREDASLNVLELFFHLLGKYWGSLKYKVIND